MELREKLIRRDDVERQTGLRRSAIYAAMEAGDFPAPVKIGKRAVAWRQSEIENWIAERPKTRHEDQIAHTDRRQLCKSA